MERGNDVEYWVELSKKSRRNEDIYNTVNNKNKVKTKRSDGQTHSTTQMSLENKLIKEATHKKPHIVSFILYKISRWEKSTDTKVHYWLPYAVGGD